MPFSLKGQTGREVQQLIPLKLPRVAIFCILKQCMFRYLSSALSLSLCYRNPFFPLKSISWLQAKKKKKKSHLLFAILKQDNKKLVTLIPTGKTVGPKNNSSSPINPITSGPLMSNPFSRLITPEEQRVTLAKDAVARESVVSVRRQGGTAGEVARWEQLSSCTDASCLPFPNLELLPLKSYEQELPHPGSANMTQMQMRN